MRIDPQIGALRGDPAAQRASQAALEQVRDAWLATAAAPVIAQLADYGDGACLQSCDALRVLMDDPDAARSAIDALFAPMLAHLQHNPLGFVPLRHQQADSFAMLQLARAGRAALTLVAYREFAQDPASVGFGRGELHEIVLAGAADILRFDLVEETPLGAAIERSPRRVVAGDRVTCADSRTTRLVAEVHGHLVMLRLSRSDEVPEDMRQFALADGRLLHRASGSRDESRREIAMAVLGRMGRADAAPLLAELSSEGSPHIRWQSLRECLALDTGTGFRALCRIASDVEDPLSSVAGALRARLIEAHPELSRLETTPCLA